MKLAFPEIEKVFDTENGLYNTLIIEAPELYSRFLSDLQSGIEGKDCLSRLSVNDKKLEIKTNLEVINSFIPFEINKKQLVTKIVSALEKTALSPEFYERSVRILGDIENLLYDVSFDFPCDLEFNSVEIGSLFKSAGIAVRDDYASTAEKVLDYMELTREFERDKLFITVNMRSFIGDGEMERFSESLLSHGFSVLGIENVERKLLEKEFRTVIDADLCEI